MQTFESEHYIFHYGANTAAARDIRKIAALQEGCFSHICAVLGLTPDFRIEYFLCDSPEEVGRIYGDDDPCNGFASPPDRIYAVYNETVQCVGFHEDAHIIRYMLNRPDCPAVREGLAMYFDRRWWGIGNLDWTGYYLKTGRYLPMDKLLDREFFCARQFLHLPDRGRLHRLVAHGLRQRAVYRNVLPAEPRRRHGTGIRKNAGRAECRF